MKELVKVFDNNQVRIINKDGEFLFHALDCANALGYKDGNKTIYKVVSEEYKSFIKSNPPQTDGVERPDNIGVPSNFGANYLSEAGLYELIFSSRLSSAAKFRKWVFEDVLPALRKTGSYSLAQQAQAVAPISPVDVLPAIEKSIEAVRRMFPNLSEASIQSIGSNLVNLCGYKDLIPLPVIKEKRYTVTEMAEFFGVSRQKLGKIISELDIRKEPYAERRLSKSEHSDKQVEQCFYSEEGFNILKGKFNSEVTP